MIFANIKGIKNPPILVPVNNIPRAVPFRRPNQFEIKITLGVTPTKPSAAPISSLRKMHHPNRSARECRYKCQSQNQRAKDHRVPDADAFQHPAGDQRKNARHQERDYRRIGDKRLGGVCGDQSSFDEFCLYWFRENRNSADGQSVANDEADRCNDQDQPTISSVKIIWSIRMCWHDQKCSRVNFELLYTLGVGSPQ